MYALTLKTGRERRVTTDARDQVMPAIGSGRSVVYEDVRAGSSDIYVFDLQTGITRPVTDDPAAQTSPDVAGDTVVWTDERSRERGRLRLYPGVPDADAHRALRHAGLRLHRASLRRAQLRLAVAGLRDRVTPDRHGEAQRLRRAVRLRHRLLRLRAEERRAQDHRDGELHRRLGQLPAAPVGTTIVPKALLGRPVLTAVKQPTSAPIPLASLKASGALKPRHKAGSAAVTLQVWARGFLPEWKLAKTLRVKVHDQNGASAYSLTVLPRTNAGWSYRVVAVHDDADHAFTQSAFSRTVRP